MLRKATLFASDKFIKAKDFLPPSRANWPLSLTLSPIAVQIIYCQKMSFLIIKLKKFETKFNLTAVPSFLQFKGIFYIIMLFLQVFHKTNFQIWRFLAKSTIKLDNNAKIAILIPKVVLKEILITVRYYYCYNFLEPEYIYLLKINNL